MKSILRNFLINLGSLWLTAQLIPALTISEGIRGLLIGAAAFMAVNILVVPLLKILLLPLNLLTLGIFAWLSNVLALYFLVTIVPSFQLVPYDFPGLSLEGFIVPALNLSTFQTAIVVSLSVGFIIHFTKWLVK